MNKVTEYLLNVDFTLLWARLDLGRIPRKVVVENGFDCISMNVFILNSISGDRLSQVFKKHYVFKHNDNLRLKVV